VSGFFVCGRDCRGGKAVGEQPMSVSGTPKSPVFVQLGGTKSHPETLHRIFNGGKMKNEKRKS